VNLNQQALADLSMQIKRWGKEFGFAEIRIADVDLSHAEAELQQWLDAGYHGEMAYMASHGTKRSRPDELVPGTVRVISARMNYLPSAEQWRETEKNMLPIPQLFQCTRVGATITKYYEPGCNSSPTKSKRR